MTMPSSATVETEDIISAVTNVNSSANTTTTNSSDVQSNLEIIEALVKDCVKDKSCRENPMVLASAGGAVLLLLLLLGCICKRTCCKCKACKLTRCLPRCCKPRKKELFGEYWDSTARTDNALSIDLKSNLFSPQGDDEAF